MTGVDTSAKRGAREQSAATSSSWRGIWRGSPHPRLGCAAFLAVVVSLGLALGLYRLGLATLRWPMPQQLFGWFSLLVAVVLLIWGIRSSIRIFLQLGVRRVLLRSAVTVVLVVLVVGLVVPSGYSGLNHWTLTVQRVLEWPIVGISAFWTDIIAVPSEVQFAATGRRPPLRVPGVDWKDGPPPPIVVRASDSGNPVVVTTSSVVGAQESSTTAAESLELPTIHTPVDIVIGSTVQVVGTDGVALRARAQPSRESAVLIRFAEGTRLTIVDGPQEAEGLTWWQVRGDAGEGWCASDFLQVIP